MGNTGERCASLSFVVIKIVKFINVVEIQDMLSQNKALWKLRKS